ncbi:unnamed protein product [Peniophora sp. CBMAI 1063]|nr:unnamed protein product [Peniophora sp. CBMAI 1063]
MASGSAQPFAPTSTPHRVQNSNPPNFASPVEPNGGASSSKAPSATPAPAPVKQPVYKGRTPRSYIPGIPLGQRDLELANGAFNRAVGALVADQRTAVDPDYETAFVDAHDVVRRLLPYHIFQLPVEAGKGKRRASEADLAREELAETRFALECHKRKRALEERFRKARMKPGKRKAPDAMTYWLEAKGLEDDKADMQALNHELRAARAELDRTERAERDKRASSTARAASAAPSSAAPATPSTPSSAYTHPYQAYRYPYGQMSPTYNTNATPYYATPASASATAPVPSTPATPTPAAAAPAVVVTPSSPRAKPTASTSASTNAMAMPRGPVPLQLPATSLPRLNQLGIYPAPRSTSSATPTPSAILLGTVDNGRLLNLEINLAALQPAQMTGLAEMLTELTQANKAQANGAVGQAGEAPSYAQMGAPYALPSKEKAKEGS